MLMTLRVIFSIFTLALAGYGLITQNFRYQAYMMLFLGLTMLVTGIQEMQKGRKITGWLLIVVFAFALYVSIQSFMLYLG